MDQVYMLYVTRHINSRNLLFLFFSIGVFIIFYEPLMMLLVRSFHDDVYDYITVIPLVSLYFFYIKRKEIFSGKEYAFQAGTAIIVLGIICYFIGTGQKAS